MSSGWLTHLVKENLLCRKLGHNWDITYWYKPAPGHRRTGTDDTYPYMPPDIDIWPGDRIIVCSCQRCKTERYDHLNTIGTLMRRKYAYSEDYARPKDEPRPMGIDLNAELMRRMEEDQI